MLVSDYMSQSPVTVQSDSEYDVAFEIMEQKGMHHLPVVDKNNEVVGILARRDLQLAARHFREAPVEISDVMHTPVHTISSNETISSATRLMIENHIGGLPVMNDGKHLVGILTETDLFRALIDLLETKA